MKSVIPNNKTKPENNQDMFDRACERLLRHFEAGRCAIDGHCVYRAQAEDGLTCCVVGYVMPDWDDIMPGQTFNGYYIGTLVNQMTSCGDWLVNVSTNLLLRLQEIHDNDENWVSPGIMKAKLAALAFTYGLQMLYDENGICLTP